MIDSNSTSPEWQVFTGTTAVLPVGSFEQHSYHLPLNTDILGAEYFAKVVAEELGAALLPALPFGTSLEHSGFRGSMSLRPETLMQIVRDLAAEVERQKFRFLVIVNGHGGNFALGPVVRDINRLDGALKILLVNWWEFTPAELSGGPTEVHAGEFETSLMLAIHPGVVREGRQDMEPVSADPLRLRQSDLNSFGMGQISPGGAVGFPTRASAETGVAILEAIRPRLTAHVRSRLELLRESPAYAGRGGLSLRALEMGDVPDGMRLKDFAHWNQLPEDWEMLLTEDPGGCLAAVRNGSVVGTASALRYETDLAWIGMVLVEPAFRGLGIGRRLLDAAMDKARVCPAVKLDATPAGRRLYDRLGFVPELSIDRWVHRCLPPIEAPKPELDEIRFDRLDQHVELDRLSIGARRHGLLRYLAGRCAAGLELACDGKLRSFCMGRPGSQFYQVGPLVAETPDDALLVARGALARLTGRSVLLDVPDHQKELREWLAALGFTRERSFTRMSLGGTRPPPIEHYQFATAGPELG